VLAIGLSFNTDARGTLIHRLPAYYSADFSTVAGVKGIPSVVFGYPRCELEKNSTTTAESAETLFALATV
jgi:hypothetical protein